MSPLNDIRKAYEGISERIRLLRCMRVHPGAAPLPSKNTSLDLAYTGFDGPKPSSSKPDTAGIDAFILLIRSMLSRGFEIPDPTPQEAALINLAWLDVGWNEEEDMDWKRMLINVLDPDGEFSADTSQLDFRTILRRTTRIGLPHLHPQSPAFQILAPMAFYCDVGTSEWTLNVSEQRTPSSWDGKSSLNDRMSRLFEFEDGGTEWVVVGKRPAFISIKLRNAAVDKQDRIKFQSMRTFKLNSLFPVDDESSAQPTTTCRRPRLSNQDADYNLFAVVRLAGAEEKDDIRFYHNDFTEVVPDEIGSYKEKEPSIKLGYPRWSVEDGGRYVLFYYRVSQPMGWPMFPPVLGDTSEYEPRWWSKSAASVELRALMEEDI